MTLPNPDDYQDWRSYMRAFVAAQLDATNPDPNDPSNQGSNGNAVPGLNWPPPGYVPVWLSQTQSDLYLGNASFDPPDALDLFQIDTANLADIAITAPKIADASIGTAKIINAAIVSALIGDAQIVTAKISDLAVNTQKVADAAINSAKIANLAVGVAHIQDASITNAKIANTIQSTDWNAGTKQGWLIDKAGNISGRSISIYDNTGALVFNAGGQIPLSRVLDAGALAGEDQITTLGQILDGLITSAKISNGTIQAADLVNAIFSVANISTYIQSGAISTALIATAAIGTALIADAAIATAKIQDGAIATAKIQDAAITNAKIASLVVNKITSGTLDATIDVGTGAFVFTIGGNRLVIGRGFGTTSQFFLWFGPEMALASMNEANGIVWFSVDGDAYFGGSLSAGTLTNSVTTSDVSSSASVELGPFGSNGGSIVVTFSWNMSTQQTANYSADVTGYNNFMAAASAVGATETSPGIWDASSSIASGATVDLDRSIGGGAYTNGVATLTVSGGTQRWHGVAPTIGDAPGQSTTTRTWGGSQTYTDSGMSISDRKFRARITSRSATPLGGTTTQRLFIGSVEE